MRLADKGTLFGTAASCGPCGRAIQGKGRPPNAKGANYDKKDLGPLARRGNCYKIVTLFDGQPFFLELVLRCPAVGFPGRARMLGVICRFDNSADAVWGTERHGLWT